MPTDFPDLFAALAAPFRDVKSFTGKGGRRLSFVTARQVCNRLDEVLGPENWWDEYTPLEHAAICRLSLRLPDGRVVTKADVGGAAGMDDEGDDDKSMISDAFKRAAVRWGVGRFLYGDGVPTFAPRPPLSNLDTPAPAPTPGERLYAYLVKHDRLKEALELAFSAGIKDVMHSWTEAQCKVVAGLLRQNAAERAAEADDSPAKPSPDPPAAAVPAMPHFENGHAFYRWAKARQEEHDVSLVNYLNTWAQEQGFRVPGKMLNWSPEEIARAHGEALRKLAALAAPPDLPLSNLDSLLLDPAPDPDFEKGLRQMQELLLGRCTEIAKLQKPGARVDGDSIRLVVAGLAQLVGKSPLSTIRGCRDAELLGDYLTAADGQLDRLRRQAGDLIPAPALPPGSLPLDVPQGVAS